MNQWDLYEARRTVTGKTKRDATLKREQRYLSHLIPDSLSYHHLVVGKQERQMAVINSDNLNEKTLLTLPGETVDCGQYVEWMDNHWLITEKDANTEVYTRAKMIQCNYLLKWVDERTRQVVERWCIVEDGTKYLTGEYGDKQYVFMRGDSRIQITIARDEYTKRLDRENRFLVDDPETETILAYRLTKPFKLSGVFNNQGVYRFVLSEVTTETTDDLVNFIPNYYKYFPRPEDPEIIDPGAGHTDSGKKVWL